MMLNRGRKIRRDDRVYFALMLPSFAMLFALTIVPLVYTVSISLTNSRITTPVPAWVGLANYLEALGDEKFWHSVAIMVGQSTSEVALQMFFGFVFAMMLQKDFLGVKVCRALFILPWAVAPVVAGLMWRMLLNTELGWVNYYLGQLLGVRINWLGDRFAANAAIVITNTWITTPAVGIMLLAALQAIDQDYYDAAAMDGATRLQLIRHMVLPMIRPTVILALLIRLMDAIRQFDITYTMTGGGPGNATESLNLYAYNQTFKYWRIGYGSALSVIMLLIILLSMSFLLHLIHKADL